MNRLREQTLVWWVAQRARGGARLQAWLEQPGLKRLREWIVRRLRPRRTLVLVTPHHWYRLDIQGPQGEAALIDGPRGALSGRALAQVLPHVLGTGARPARRVWVLFTGLKPYTLSMASSQVADLEGALLRQALLHELEEGHGLNVSRMDVGWSRIRDADGLADFYVVMGSKGLFEMMHKVVRKSGCRLEGLSYPGPLPGMLLDFGENPAGSGGVAEQDELLDDLEDDPVGPLAWHRLEYWPDMVLGVRGLGDQVAEVECLPPENGNLERWLGQQQAGEPEELIRGDGQPVPERLPGYLDLHDRADVACFLGYWAMALQPRYQARVAWLAPAISPQTEIRLSVGMAAVVGALCLAHGGFQVWARSGLVAERQALEAQHAEIDALDQQNQTERREIEQLKKTVEGLKAQDLPGVLEKLRSRSTRLMTLLGQYVGDDVVVENIHFEGNTLSIRGVALRVSEANRLFLVLTRELAGYGVRVFPPDKTEMHLLEGGGPWEYTIRMEDTGLAGFGGAGAHP